MPEKNHSNQRYPEFKGQGIFSEQPLLVIVPNMRALGSSGVLREEGDGKADHRARGSRQAQGSKVVLAAGRGRLVGRCGYEL